jgi:precorrin-6B methylase 2
MLIDVLLIIKLGLVLAAFLLLAIIGFVMASFRDKVPFVPTPRKIVKRMVEMADILANEKICDLGSGSGRIIFTVAKFHRENLIVGIEKSLTLRLVSKFFRWLHLASKKRIQIINQDFFNIDLYDYDVIFCFLTPEAMRILAPKFQTLKPGSRIISYMFPLENQPALAEARQNFLEVIDQVTEKDSIYYYKKLS